LADIELRAPETEREFELYYDLRWRILREPWTQSRDTARDEHEADAIHLMAWLGAIPVGVGRLHFNSPEEGHIRYMAVEPAYAGKGIGGRILEELESRARALGATRIVLNAREKAIPFYRKHGYELVDQSGTLFGSIVHWWMRKTL
jgi:GNAT superfamily N-acetyltransferase